MNLLARHINERSKGDHYWRGSGKEHSSQLLLLTQSLPPISVLEFGDAQASTFLLQFTDMVNPLWDSHPLHSGLTFV